MACSCGPGHQCDPLKPGCWGYQAPREQPSRDDAEQLLDAQLLIGMIERYRPGTVEEARRWFANHLTESMQASPPELNDLGKQKIEPVEEPGCG